MSAAAGVSAVGVSAVGIVAYGAYVPHHRLSRAEVARTLGGAPGRGMRVVASFDEDSTTMGVEAARTALRSAAARHVDGVSSLWFATTSPAYLDKANAAGVHAALRLSPTVFAADLAGSARSGIAALRAAGADGGLAVLADVRVGRPGSGDERDGGDGAAAFLMGDADDAIAVVVAHASVTAEFLDRWRVPGEPAVNQWEERFGLEAYQPLVERAGADALAAAGLETADHVVLVSPNPGVVKRARSLLTGRLSTSGSPIGHAGAADAGVALADVLDRAAPGSTILVVSAADGCDAVVLRATSALDRGRQPVPVASQVAAGNEVPYATYLSWRGFLEREPPRRPEPERPAGPPSRRSVDWKFGFSASRCRECGFVHLPPSRVCKSCRTVDRMEECSLADVDGTVATYTVDRLAHSPSPPMIDAVIDFDGGGRTTLEVADARPEDLRVGARVTLSFRRLFTAGGVHNYFWKARIMPPELDEKLPSAVGTAKGENDG